MIRILYLGSESAGSTSLHRLNALKRLGYAVEVYDPAEAVRPALDHPVTGFFHYRTGYRFLQRKIFDGLKSFVKHLDKIDLVWVDSGEFLGPQIITFLNGKLQCPTTLFNHDDPTGKRDGGRFSTLIKTLPYYDLVNVVRKETADECRTLGAKKVRLIWRSYDEAEHHPFENTSLIPNGYRSEVSFVGTWIRNEKRDKFFMELLNQGVPVAIWGNRWHKSPYWNELKQHYRGPALAGRDYVAAIQGAKICIGLLSKGNRDLHTTRSLEIPYAGGLFCAERTSEHLQLYKEGVEAVFWQDAKECADCCKELLKNDKKRDAIRIGGMKRVRELHLGNEDTCTGIMNAMGL